MINRRTKKKILPQKLIHAFVADPEKYQVDELLEHN